MPLRGFAGLLSGLEVMSTTSFPFDTLARLLGKLYMSAVLMTLAGAGTATTAASWGECSRRARLLVGDSGVEVVELGFCWAVKDSFCWVETECFRFNVPASAEDIDLGAGVRSCPRLHCTLMELGCWDDAGSFRASTAAACSMMITIMLDT